MKKDNNIAPEAQLREIIDAYEALVKGIDEKAKQLKGRAYGGIVRAGKGKLVESIAKSLVIFAWEKLVGETSRLSFGSKKLKIPIKDEYVKNIKEPLIKLHVFKNKFRYYYSQKSDLHVLIDNKIVMGIECKAYTENAMMKRILVDFSLLKQGYPNIDCVLLQLESQLGGDYSELKPTQATFGSPSTHTLLSNFDIDLHIITLLKGERKVDKPIHDPDYYKPLLKDSLTRALKTIETLLNKYK